MNGTAGQAVQPSEADAELPAALRGCKVVNLVNDDRFDRAQHGTDVFPTEEQLKGLRRRDQKVGWSPGLFGTLGLWRITVPNIHTKTDRLSEFRQSPVDVAVQRPKRGDVQNRQVRPSFVQATVKQRQDSCHGFS